MQHLKARVTVTLKNGVLDPQGAAIAGALRALAFDELDDVRQGKIFDIKLRARDRGQARQQLERMCERLLANAVIEEYAVTFID